MRASGARRNPAQRLATNPLLRSIKAGEAGPVRQVANPACHYAVNGWRSGTGVTSRAAWRETRFDAAAAPWAAFHGGDKVKEYKSRAVAMARWGQDSEFRRGSGARKPSPAWAANAVAQCDPVTAWVAAGSATFDGFAVPEGREDMLRPNTPAHELRQLSYGKRDKNGAVTVDWLEKDAAAAPETVVAGHSAEYAAHKRVKNPDVPKAKNDLSDLEWRRLRADWHYHAGKGKDLFVLDAAVGSDAATATSIRTRTETPNCAYLQTIFACRSGETLPGPNWDVSGKTHDALYAHYGEERAVRSCVQAHQYAGYEFELPRVVEEFGGPKPADFGLSAKDGNANYVALHPYGIPMAGGVCGNTDHREYLKALSFLTSRWAFYADGDKHVTLGADAVLDPATGNATVVIDAKAGAMDQGLTALRLSPHLWGAHNIRLGAGNVSRAWNAVAVPAAGAATRAGDMVDSTRGVLYRPLPTVVGETTVAPLGRRQSRDARRKAGLICGAANVAAPGDATAAAAGGHLLGSPVSPHAARARPASLPLKGTKIAVLNCDKADDAAKAAVAAIVGQGILYAEEAALTEAIAAVFATAQVVPVASGKAKDALASLAAKGVM